MSVTTVKPTLTKRWQSVKSALSADWNMEAPMTWFINLVARDGAPLSGKMRIPVNAGTIPTGYAAYANAVAAAIYGTGLLSIGEAFSASLEIDLGLTLIPGASTSEIRNRWQATMLVGTVPALRFSIPAANTDDTLIAAGTKWAGNLTLTPFTGALAALLNTSGTVHMVEPDEGNPITDWSPVLRMVRARKRPRIGGSR